MRNPSKKPMCILGATGGRSDSGPLNPAEVLPRLATAAQIAERLNLSPRYVLMLASQRKIPCIRIAKRCVRFDPLAVGKALGIPTRKPR